MITVTHLVTCRYPVTITSIASLSSKTGFLFGPESSRAASGDEVGIEQRGRVG